MKGPNYYTHLFACAERRDAQVLALRAEGRTISDIARVINTSRARVYQILARAELRERRQDAMAEA